MKKSTKKSILIGAAAALAASLVPYECKVEENGDFSFTSLLLGVYRRRRADDGHQLRVDLAAQLCQQPGRKIHRRHKGEVAVQQCGKSRCILAGEAGAHPRHTYFWAVSSICWTGLSWTARWATSLPC